MKEVRRRKDVSGCKQGETCGKRGTLRSQFALRSKLEGLRSRWMTSAECSALSARRV